MPNELSGRQRFELGMLCAEYEARQAEPGALDAIRGLLIGYTLAEGITPEHFSESDMASQALHAAFLAAQMGALGVAGGLSGRSRSGC